MSAAASAEHTSRARGMQLVEFAVLQKNVHLERENSRLNIQMKDLRTHQGQLKAQLRSASDSAQKEKDDTKTKHNVHELQNKTINECVAAVNGIARFALLSCVSHSCRLMLKVRQQEERHAELLRTGKQAKNKLEEFAPDIAANKNGSKRTVNWERFGSKRALRLFSESTGKCDIVTAEIVEQLINEIAKIKTQLSNAELQLYEAHEKMAEITENVSAACGRERVLPNFK